MNRPLLEFQQDSEVEISDAEENEDSEAPYEIRTLEVRPPPSVPVDKYNVTYIVFYLLGMASVIPWNFIITAEEYWMFKFRNITTSSNSLTPLQRNIISDLSVASAVPSTLFLILNAFFSHYVPLKVRMIVSISGILTFFILTTALVEVDTDKWQTGFFAITIISVVVMNIFAAIVAGSLYGIAGLFPSEYMTAVVSGQALCGIVTALTNILTLTFGTSPKVTAFIYFIVGDVFMCISILSYVLISRSVFFRHFVCDEVQSFSTSRNCEVQKSHGYEGCPNMREVFRKIYLYALSEFFVFVITLSVYPSITVLVQSQYHGNGHLWNDVYFTPVVNYLLFNSGDYMGRILGGTLVMPNKPKLLFLLCLLRTGFIPILMMSNIDVHYFLPIVVRSDLVYIAIMIVFAMSNGYIANTALIMVPRVVMQHEKEIASSIMAAFLGLGLAFGTIVSLAMIRVL